MFETKRLYFLPHPLFVCNFKPNKQMMARSKGFIFPPTTQSAAAFGKAFGHEARVEMLERLSSGRALSYEDLIAGIALQRSTLGDHVKQLERAGLIKPVLLLNNLGGYQLNRQQLVSYLKVVREKFKTTTVFRELEAVSALEEGC